MADTAERDLQALELRRQGADYDQIGRRLGMAKSSAWEAVQRALRTAIQEAAPEVRQLELDRLDALQIGVLAVFRRPHYVVSGGKIVTDDQGNKLVDDGPVLAATRTMLLLMERRARLLGLDAPARVDVKVMTIDQMDQRIAELVTLLGDDAGPTSGG